jgi:hypothetical protein
VAGGRHVDQGMRHALLSVAAPRSDLAVHLWTHLWVDL